MSSFHDPTDPHHFVISYTGIFYPEKDPYTFFRALRSWFDAMQPEARKRMERLLRVRLIGTPEEFAQTTVRYGTISPPKWVESRKILKNNITAVPMFELAEMNNILES